MGSPPRNELYIWSDFKGSFMKVYVTLVSLILFTNVYANEKIDFIIETLEYEQGFTQTLGELYSPLAARPEIDDGSEASEMMRRHASEDSNIYNKYFNWENLRPEIVLAIEKAYTPSEIDVLYKFLKTEEGRSVYKKMEKVGELFAHSLSDITKLYMQEMQILDERQSKELEELIAKAEKEQKAVNKNKLAEQESQEVRISDVVRFSVATENGEMVGYNVRPGSRNDLYKRSAFQDGDLVTALNGIQINGPSKIKEVYHMLKTVKQIHVEVVRKGKNKDFVIDLLELENSN